MVVVVEPTLQSVATAHSILELTSQIGIREVRFIGNKIAIDSDTTYLKDRLEADKFLGFIPYSEDIRQADRNNWSLIDRLDGQLTNIFKAIYQNILTSGKIKPTYKHP